MSKVTSRDCTGESLGCSGADETASHSDFARCHVCILSLRINLIGSTIRILLQKNLGQCLTIPAESLPRELHGFQNCHFLAVPCP